jgi:hypothetical protein
MDLSEARARIDAMFMDDAVEPQLQEAEYLAILAPLAALSDDELQQIPRQARKFLYYGALAFDRWSPPTPVVVEPNLVDGFRSFLDTFRRCEPEHPNLSALGFHELQNQVFEQWATRSMDPSAVDLGGVEAIRGAARQLSLPSIPQLRDIALQAQSKVVALCDGLQQGNVRSQISTVLPHAVVRTEFTGTGSWHGLDFSYALTPDATYADGMTASESATVAPVGLTRADSGTCRVIITIHGLVDYNAWSPYLAGTDTIGPGRFHSGQPWCQTLLYLLLSDLVPCLQDSGLPSVDPLWVLTPRDIGQLSIHITAGDVTVVHVPLLSLGGWQVTWGPLEPQTLHIKDLQPNRYWTICRRHAQGYLTLGATKEALLWLNMAVEALIDERIESLTEGQPELHNKLTGSKLLFAEAENTVAEQFPSMAGQIKWPDREQAPSRYAQLKTLCHEVPLPVKAKIVQTKYALISKERNDLIHGRNTGFVSSESITVGLEALDWLADNLQLQDHLGTEDSS